ncbi:tyrosine-type recombinase/integrase [Microbacterium sp. A93]|uniref:tyrosine-type recombinase/integrase n=1 Tax=Microbacterium sp. A93 TaxID=3450716 RepID=UPI003F423B8F
MAKSRISNGELAALDLRVELDARFLLDPIPLDVEARYSKPPCAVPGCGMIAAQVDARLCRTDQGHFRKSGSSDVESWILTQHRTVYRRKSPEGFDVAAAGLMRDELAYGLSKRAERDQITLPGVVGSLARVLAASKYSSLLELRHNRIKIEEISRATGGYTDVARAFLLDTLDVLCLLAGHEPTRRYLGIAAAGGGAFVNHNLITNAEFAASIERWMNYRLAAEIGAPQYIQAMHGHLSAFCAYLDFKGVTAWKDLAREHMLGFLAHIKTVEYAPGRTYSAKYQIAICSAINVFIDEAGLNEWADIRRSARWLPNELPKVSKSPPRLIGKQVAARLRDAGNLQLVEDLDCRLIIRIAAETGLRRKDIAAGMTTDALLDLGDDRWSIVYRDSKSKKMKSAPVHAGVAKAIQDHISYKQTKLPGTRNLFARNLKDTVITLTLINNALTKLIKALDIRTSSGEYLPVTPHMFRHQNATDWLNGGMSLVVVQKLLGHDSIVTTEIYGRMSEQAVREAWEKSRAVSNTGEVVERPIGIMEEAAWTHAFMGGASQALPNGKCGMPCGETCEHANACLFCPLFMTTPEYLPVLREQRDEHAQMIEMANEHGHVRIAEKNQRPFLALNKLIASLEQIERRDLALAEAGE